MLSSREPFSGEPISSLILKFECVVAVICSSVACEKLSQRQDVGSISSRREPLEIKIITRKLSNITNLSSYVMDIVARCCQLKVLGMLFQVLCNTPN
jgi:hypothetical protein